MASLAAFSAVLLLSIAQFFSDRINIEKSKYRQHIISFAAAIAITYLLFSFLPKAYLNSSGLALFAPLMTGFVLIHVLEKLFYGKFKARFSLKKVRGYHDELHAAVLFVYHFVVGAVLIGVVEASLLSGALFLVPLMLFTTIGNWSLHHEYLQKIPFRRVLLASSTLLGALFAKSTLNTAFIENILINFVAGILLFIVVRETLPQPKEGKLKLFILGLITYGIIMFATQEILY